MQRHPVSGVAANTFKHSFLLDFFRRCFQYISKQWVSRLRCGVVKPPAGNYSESQGQRLSSCKALWSWCWNQKMESVSGSIKFSLLQWPVVLEYHHTCGLLCFCLMFFGLLNACGNRDYRYATGPFMHRLNNVRFVNESFFELDLISESSKPFHKTSLNNLFTYWSQFDSWTENLVQLHLNHHVLMK